jgi:ADP-heptose:LPS heptosyltransferase
VALHPGVSKMSLVKNILKCPDENFWSELIQKLLEMGKRVVLLGGPDDKDIIEKLSNIEHKNLINLFGKTKNIQELASIINKSSAFICVDSAPMHIGVSLSKNVFAIFAGTDSKKLIPNEPNFKVIKNKNCSCSPCLWDKRQTSCESPVCLNIDPNEILELLQA